MRDTRGATAQHAVEGPGPPLAAGSHNNKKEACPNDTKTRLYWSAPSNRKLCLLRSLPSLRSGRAARLRQVLPTGLTGCMRGSHWRNAARHPRKNGYFWSAVGPHSTPFSAFIRSALLFAHSPGQRREEQHHSLFSPRHRRLNRQSKFHPII